jgi:hypothetical protein
VIAREDVPQTQPNRLGDLLLLLVYRRRVVLAAHVLERWFGLGTEGRVALALRAELTPLFQVAMDDHSFLEELLHRWVEARQQRRLLPSLWCDLGEHVRAGESMRKQLVEQSVKLPARETLRFSRHHTCLTFPSSGADTQDQTRRRPRTATSSRVSSRRMSASDGVSLCGTKASLVASNCDVHITRQQHAAVQGVSSTQTGALSCTQTRRATAHDLTRCRPK